MKSTSDAINTHIRSQKLIAHLIRTVTLIVMTGMLFVAPAAAQQRTTTDEVHQLPTPTNLRAYSRQWRVDLYWDEPLNFWNHETWNFQLERGPSPHGPFEPLHDGWLQMAAHSDFHGKAGGKFHYRVRMVEVTKKSKQRSGEHAGAPQRIIRASPWSSPVSGSPQPFDADKLVTEVQEAGFRYYYDAAHPVSGLPREMLPSWNRNVCSIASVMFASFNLIVGVEREFITREQAAERVLKMARFLATKGTRYHGAFPHWMNGETGEVHPFAPRNDGADSVETAFAIAGLIAAREYFDRDDPVELEIRALADKLWHEVEWTWFVRQREQDGSSVINWLWSPEHEWAINLGCTGFNETHIVYILAVASPTHPVPTRVYYEGWQHEKIGTWRSEQWQGVTMHWNSDLPLFCGHYSYLGFDPRALSYRDRSFYDSIRLWCQAQIRYMRSRSEDFKGYEGPLWGLTASLNRDGYKAHGPGERDDGTITPTAALASMPYLPDESRAALVEMFTKYGKRLWGPFGFYDAFNLTQDWCANAYISIDVGPIAPMIENHRTGKCWEIFMKAPEIQRAIRLLRESEPSN